jgi:hypothetical protein
VKNLWSGFALEIKFKIKFKIILGVPLPGQNQRSLAEG